MNNSSNAWITENPLFKNKNQRYYYDFGTGIKIEREEVKEEREALLNAANKTSTEPQNQKKDDFLEGFDDPYGEKREQERQRKEQERKERLAKIRENADKRTWVDGKVVEDPAKTDPFLDGFNGASNEQRVKFPNTQLQAKNTTADDKFREGFNDPYGEKEKEEKSKWQKVLDGISTGLTAASFIPGLDTFTNIAQIPVDLLRGDFVGAGLDLVGAIPFVGEIADIGKTARTADRIIDGVRATDKLVDGVKVADGMSDGVKAINQSSDILKSTDEIFDVAKTSDVVVNTTRTGKNAGEFAKAYPKENLPEEINDCLSKLLDDGDKIQVSRAPDLEEISLMSRQESVEFASVTIGNRNYVLRGNATGTTISQDMLDDMIQNKGILNCHSHPYIGDFRPSPSDLQLAEILNHQKEFRIVTPDGMQAIYTKEGIKSVGNIGNKLSEEDILELYKLFGG